MTAPSQGDYGFISLDPVKGHEQAGRRPVVIVSCDAFNAATGLAWVVPVTSKIKGRPKEIAFPDGHEISGFILLEHMRCIDPNARKFQSLGNVGQEFLDEEIPGRLCAIIPG